MLLYCFKRVSALHHDILNTSSSKLPKLHFELWWHQFKFAFFFLQPLLALQLFSPGCVMRVSGNLSAWPSVNTLQAADWSQVLWGSGREQFVCKLSRVRRVAEWDAGTLRDVLLYSKQHRRRSGQGVCRWQSVAGHANDFTQQPEHRTHAGVHLIYCFWMSNVLHTVNMLYCVSVRGLWKLF